MDSNRIKEIQEETAYPQSISVYKALMQVWNECQQEHNEQLRIANVIKSICACENSEKEKDSLIPVYCNNCNAYVQTVL